MPTMMTRTTATANEALLLALDLGNRTWKLGFTVGGGALPPRIRTIGARDLAALAHELLTAKARFGLAREAPVGAPAAVAPACDRRHCRLSHVGPRRLTLSL